MYDPRLVAGAESEDPRLLGDEGVLILPNEKSPPLFFLEESRLGLFFFTFLGLAVFSLASLERSALGDRLWAVLGMMVRVRIASLLLERGGGGKVAEPGVR